jgi:hypothetical protein
MLPHSPDPFSGIPLNLIAEEQGATIQELKDLDPIATAATFGGLLALPDLQASCLRLELLVHLAIAHCSGRKAPRRGFVMRAFERLGCGYCGHAEDPSEDVFVANVRTTSGNFRILQGIRESPAFCLQRLLNVVQTMPQGRSFDGIRSSAEALLGLSDAVVARARLRDNCLGQQIPLKSIPRQIADRLANWRAVVRFSRDDLDQLGLPWAPLSEFCFNPSDGLLSGESHHGHSALERRPILADGQTLYLVLPTATATAITRFVIERVQLLGLTRSFERVLAHEIAATVGNTRLIAEPAIARAQFQEFEGGSIALIVKEIDPGRFVHLLLFVDGLKGFAETGMAGANAGSDALGKRIDDYLQRAAAESAERTDFREALALIVVAGLGRNIVFPLRRHAPRGSWVEMISAADFVTISHLRRFDWAALWKLLESRRRIEEQQIHILNINGLLNLVAWADELDGHIVPPDCTPLEDGDRPSTVLTAQNALRIARHTALADYEMRRVLDTDNQWLLVQKDDSSLFTEDDRAPFFVSEEHLLRGQLKGVYMAKSRAWWVQISAAEGSARSVVFNYWQMLCTWLRRAAPVLDEAYSELPIGPVSFDVRFGKLLQSGPSVAKRPDEADLRALIRVTAKAGTPEIVITIADGFDEGFQRPENTAERLIVEAVVRGAALAADEQNPARVASLVADICPNDQARHVHAFEAKGFRDYLGEQLNRKPTVIDRLDNAASRIGLAWKTRERGRAAEIRGVQECTGFLNDTVQALMTEMCAALKRFGRRDFLAAVLFNHECAAHDREKWRRTAKANLALRQDRAAAMAIIVQHEAELNACFLGSRILAEAAICECPCEGQYKLGRFDLSRLLGDASMVFHLGGFSDAIHWGAVEPHIRTTMLGDVLLPPRFFDSVYEPYGRVGTESRVTDAVDAYPQLYAPRKAAADISAVFEGEFLAAWSAELRASFEGMRQFLDDIEDVAVKRSEPVLTLKASEVLQMLADAAGLSRSEADLALGALCLAPRSRWPEAPIGFEDRDWYPWRFRRRLSILRRPLIQLDSSEDPLLMIAPGLAREAFAYTVSGFHSGEIPQWQARSREMQSWLGTANHRPRLAFNAEVAARLSELGWRVELELKLTKLLNQSLPKDYGDVDVLAYKRSSGRVLVIECKDVQYKKTLGEVAEQLADYRGELKPNGEPDDLKRHLDRVAILRAHSQRVADYVGLPGPIQLDGYLVFKNPVPMRFAWEHMAGQIQLSLFDDLAQL